MEPSGTFSGTFVPFFLLPHLFFSLAAAGRCTPALGAGTHLVDLNSGGLERRFLLDVPAGVDVGAGLPALISMHGYSASPYYYSLLTGTARYNEDQHYDERHPTAAGSFEYLQRGYKWLVALPFGTAEKPSPHCCPANASDAACRGGTLLDQSNPCSWNAGGCCGTAPDRRVDDVGFVRAIASWLKSAMCADDDLFAMGFSNGAMMANRLGCDAADLFRGIAPVGRHRARRRLCRVPALACCLGGADLRGCRRRVQHDHRADDGNLGRGGGVRPFDHPDIRERNQPLPPVRGLRRRGVRRVVHGRRARPRVFRPSPPRQHGPPAREGLWVPAGDQHRRLPLRHEPLFDVAQAEAAPQ